MTANGFIAQDGAERYNANIAIMDSLAMHGNNVAAPLNINPHGILVLSKEAVELTIIPSPTVKLNRNAPVGARVNKDRRTMIAEQMSSSRQCHYRAADSSHVSGGLCHVPEGSGTQNCRASTFHCKQGNEMLCQRTRSP